MLQSSITPKRDIAIEARDQGGRWQIPLPSPEALTRRRRIERIIEGLFVDSGYEEIAVPVVDYEAPDLGSGRRYRLLDRDGELLALRADFTPFVLRAISRLKSPRERVWYRGDVVQPDPTALGAPVESWEMGAELITAEPGGDAEVIRLALAAADSAGVPIRIEISDVRIVEALLGVSAADAGLARAVRRSLETKNGAQLEALRESLTAETFETLERLRTGNLTSSDLSGAARQIASGLDALRAELRSESVEVHLDDVWESSSYYSALRFRLTASDGAELGLGGRYSLPGGLGPIEGVGFKLGMDGLERASRRTR